MGILKLVFGGTGSCGGTWGLEKRLQTGFSWRRGREDFDTTSKDWKSGARVSSERAA